MRLLIPTMLLALLTLAPLAAAQDETDKTNETRPTDGSADPSAPSQAAGDDAAWVEDCPPDMMCAYGSEDCIECSGPSDEGPGRLGPDDCIDCTRGPADGSCEYCRGETNDSGTCMDGTDPGEICDRDVQYLGGPSSGEAEPTSAPVDAQSDGANAVPGASFAFVVVAIALAVFLLARRG